MIDLNQTDWAIQSSEDSNGVIIDVRTDMEVEEGKIPGAIQYNIQYSSQFMAQIKSLDPEKNYYVYCRSGGRSVQACMLMNAVGIKNTYNLLDGISAWTGDLE
ncbi:MAG: rhodanese-like domain-containing protein [Bacteroidetes bacterium]|jgi:rhodanese-related sulfurtransferase|nr:rhodanese-like domain-containing protein [Bacteroidota bacterium]HCK06609.1 rhodanese-like domain-containing protein [Flavobacteriaceae bacterium]